MNFNLNYHEYQINLIVDLYIYFDIKFCHLPLIGYIKNIEFILQYKFLFPGRKRKNNHCLNIITYREWILINKLCWMKKLYSEIIFLLYMMLSFLSFDTNCCNVNQSIYNGFHVKLNIVGDGMLLV